MRTACIKIKQIFKCCQSNFSNKATIFIYKISKLCYADYNHNSQPPSPKQNTTDVKITTRKPCNIESNQSNIESNQSNIESNQSNIESNSEKNEVVPNSKVVDFNIDCK